MGFHPKGRCSTDFLPTGCLPMDYHPMDYHPKGCRSTDCPPMGFLPKDCLPTGFHPTVSPNPAGCRIPADYRKRLAQAVSMPTNWCQAGLMRSSRTFS
jgi:hypothetical protein